MTDTPKIWRGAISVHGGLCDECSERADVVFQIVRAAMNTENSGRWACRSCVLDASRNIAAIDRRGDDLHAEQMVRELDAQTAIALHLEIRDRAESERHGIDFGTLDALPLPAGYVHVLAVLEKLARVDDEFAATITEMRARYEQASFFGPKQMLLIQWRLAKHGVSHDPAKFVVSVRSEKEIAQLRGFDGWRRKNLAPYLSWAQRSRFGF